MRKMATPKTVAVALAASMMASTVQAGAIIGATEITQILNNFELLYQAEQMYEQVQQTIQQVRMAQQQLKNLEAAPQQQWGQAQQELTRLAELASRTSAISYASGSIDQSFRNAYPGYAANPGAINFGQRYKDLFSKSMDGLNNALQTAGLNASQFSDERAAIQQIQSMSAGSEGALQAMQAGNMIASQTVDQLQKLRQLLALQAQSQSNFLAAQAQMQNDKVQSTTVFMKQGDGSIRRAGQSGFRGY